MTSRCPSCGAPITDDKRFCAHCGCRLPDIGETAGAKAPDEAGLYDEAVQLEELRLKYEMEEKIRREEAEKRQKTTKTLRIKRWVSWILCIAFFCVGFLLNHKNDTLSVIFAVLFFATGIYAVFITLASVFRRRK